MCERESDEHQIEARLSERRVEMSDRRGEDRDVFGEQMIGVFDATIEIGNFIVGLVGEILFVSVVYKPCTAMNRR